MTVAWTLSGGCQKRELISRVHRYPAPEGHILGVNVGAGAIERAPGIVEGYLRVRNIPPAPSSERAMVVRE